MAHKYTRRHTHRGRKKNDGSSRTKKKEVWKKIIIGSLSALLGLPQRRRLKLFEIRKISTVTQTSCDSAAKISFIFKFILKYFSRTIVGDDL